MIYVVTGHICSGKSTYVKEHSRPRDIIIDMDTIAMAISHDSIKPYEYEPHIRSIARSTRWSIVQNAVLLHRSESLGRHDAPFNVWIIHAYPDDSDERMYFMMDAKTIHVDAPPETLLQRARNERPQRGVDELLRRFSESNLTPQTAPPGGGGGVCQSDSDGKPHAPTARISDLLSPNRR